MRLSRFHLNTSKETPGDAEIASHRLMLRAGMIRKHAAGLYTWSPLGLRVMRKVEQVVREEMDRAGAVELLMPTVQPRELWEETGRWEKFGGQLLKIKDRKEAEYCYAPTAEEVITDFARSELRSYKQLPVNFYQIQTKFRDEIRPRFGVMRAREFLMKDAYSFHVGAESMAQTYQAMYDAYTRIFERLGLRFRAVAADTGAIGGSASHEFHVLADSGEDAIAFSDGSDYAANVEMAEAVAPGAPRPAAAEPMQKVSTPWQRTCEEVAKLLGIALERTVKSVAIMAGDDFVLALVRGDHVVNEIKLAKLAGLADYRLATEAEILAQLGCEPGFLGPVAPRSPVRIVADRSVAAMADFVVGANEKGFHLTGVNWGRDLPEPEVADIRSVAVRRSLAGRPRPADHRTRHRGRPRVPARAEVRRGDGRDRARRRRQGAGHAHGLLRRRRDPHRRRRHRAELRRQRHRLARADGAVAGRGLPAEPARGCRRHRRRRVAVPGSARARRRGLPGRPRAAPGRDVRRPGADRPAAPRGGVRARAGRRQL